MIKLLCVVVIYNQRFEQCNTYKTLISKNNQFDVFLYDNSQVAQHSDNEFAGTNVKYISDINNSGLSYAYNKAIDYAKLINCNWLMILDQDTIFDSNLINEFLKTQIQYNDLSLFVPVVKIDDTNFMSPSYIYEFKGDMSNKNLLGIVDSKKYHAINSGCIINLNVFDNIGPYNLKTWLDFSDVDFFARYKQKYNSFYVLNSICYQEFSNQVQSNSQKINRFRIYNECVKASYKSSLLDILYYKFILIKRAFSLVISTKSCEPIKILFSK